MAAHCAIPCCNSMHTGVKCHNIATAMLPYRGLGIRDAGMYSYGGGIRCGQGFSIVEILAKIG